MQLARGGLHRPRMLASLLLNGSNRLTRREISCSDWQETEDDTKNQQHTGVRAVCLARRALAGTNRRAFLFSLYSATRDGQWLLVFFGSHWFFSLWFV